MQSNLFIKKYSLTPRLSSPPPPYNSGHDANKILAEVKDALLTFKALDIIKNNQPVSHSDFIRLMQCPTTDAVHGLNNALSETWAITIEIEGSTRYILPSWRVPA
ncbi:hypothetical protein [Mucilaginibacter sp. NFR10]|uniref:hypothetical protein n=1 Tax=Mucilaginibacter sp. NFR10 TaxID=1566292 RepID=UPI0008718C48|nr:hypothetical protein [Mucilaginibacter sp. NFR10]SCW88403.1 hypothetical protein SAMN03159284_05385 [Mucilaginibacter sp. NFR10]